MSRSSKDREDHVCYRQAVGREVFLLSKQLWLVHSRSRECKNGGIRKSLGVGMPSGLAHTVRDKGSQCWENGKDSLMW